MLPFNTIAQYGKQIFLLVDITASLVAPKLDHTPLYPPTSAWRRTNFTAVEVINHYECFFIFSIELTPFCLGIVKYEEYSADDCKGSLVETVSSVADTCATYTDDDDDDDDDDIYYGLGDGAQSIVISCVNVASATFLVDARVVAGLIIGGITLLAL